MWPKCPQRGREAGDPATYLFPDSVAQMVRPRGGDRGGRRSRGCGFPSEPR